MTNPQVRICKRFDKHYWVTECPTGGPYLETPVSSSPLAEIVNKILRIRRTESNLEQVESGDI